MERKVSKRWLVWGNLCLVGLLMLVGSAFVAASAAVAETEQVQASAISQGKVAEVELAGVVMFRFTHDFYNLTPQERAAIVYRRLGGLLGAYQSDLSSLAESVKADQRGGDWVVVAGDQLVVTIDPKYALALKSAPWELAEIWAENMRLALKKYKLTMLT